jgi:hypothetical protein
MSRADSDNKNKPTDPMAKVKAIKGVISLDADLAIKQAERLGKALLTANYLARKLTETLAQLKIKVE